MRNFQNYKKFPFNEKKCLLVISKWRKRQVSDQNWIWLQGVILHLDSLTIRTSQSPWFWKIFSWSSHIWRRKYLTIWKIQAWQNAERWADHGKAIWMNKKFSKSELSDRLLENIMKLMKVGEKSWVCPIQVNLCLSTIYQLTNLFGLDLPEFCSKSRVQIPAWEIQFLLALFLFDFKFSRFECKSFALKKIAKMNWRSWKNSL